MHHRVDGPGNPDVVADVVLDEREARVPEEMLDVVDRPGHEVVERDDFIPAREQRVREVRTEEPSTTADDDPGHQPSLPMPL